MESFLDLPSVLPSMYADNALNYRFLRLACEQPGQVEDTPTLRQENETLRKTLEQALSKVDTLEQLCSCTHVAESSSACAIS